MQLLKAQRKNKAKKRREIKKNSWRQLYQNLGLNSATYGLYLTTSCSNDWNGSLDFQVTRISSEAVRVCVYQDDTLVWKTTFPVTTTYLIQAQEAVDICLQLLYKLSGLIY